MSAVSRIAPTTTTAITITAIPSIRPIRSTSRCSGVRCSSVRPSRRAMLPISVAIPVAVTTARPRPRDRRAAEHHVHPVAQAGRPGERRDLLQHRLALARQRRLGHRQRRRLDEPRVGGDRVALREQKHVARHDLGRGNPLLAPVAHDARRRRRHPLQRRDRLLGARLLHVAEDRVQRRRSQRSRSRRTARLRRPRAPTRPARPRPPRAAGRSAGRRTGRGTSARHGSRRAS